MYPFCSNNNKAQIEIRIGNESDINELQTLFQETVLTINRADYSQAEVEDWASCGEILSRWENRIRNQYFIVAQNKTSGIIGFSSALSSGYLDFMFIHKDYQRQGIGTALLSYIEDYLKEIGISLIESEVSITARPFFEKRGYQVVKEQKRKANQLLMTNFVMEKKL